ncbi:hypothetical protein [Klebsiella michiganensis]|uniref:hypothetical protein n=1 Tax=Klebsiella michiganensis TaxID=1134687 RepID=UPI00187D4987|nr:hypothetical protein [Klebsiella michiganensis]
MDSVHHIWCPLSSQEYQDLPDGAETTLTLNRREIHLYDRDVPAYAEAVNAVNARGNGCWAAQTLKHEVESYLHPDAIYEAFGVTIAVTDHPVGGKATPKVFAEAYSLAQRFDGVMKDNAAKARLAERAFPLMTAAHDP